MNSGNRKRQTGAALLLLLLVVVVAASTVLVTQLSAGSLRSEQSRETQSALAAAKRALLNYAATYADLVPGEAAQLPCPDLDASGAWQDGESHSTSCGAAGVTVLGRFPWRTLGAEVPRDASGSCLWYAVSGSYKTAAAATAVMINPDANGQLQLYSVETGAVIDGVLPEERPVAFVLAPLQPLPGQVRTGAGAPGRECSDDFNAAAYLDTAVGLGISNAALSGTAGAIESFATSAAVDTQHNDRVLSISRAELAAAVYRRHDFPAMINALTRGLASCIAAYGLQNPSGPTDRRLPLPAPVPLADYSAEVSYNDADTGVFSGRLPDIVDDSNSLTGNTIARVVSDCNTAIAADWDPAYLSLWRNWKDHFFYIVAESHQANASVPTTCGACLSMNGSGAYVAVVFFAGQRLPALGQRRNTPPADADTKRQIGNYLEGLNSGNHPYSGGAADFESQVASAAFNDVAYCVDGSMAVTAC